MPLYEFMCCDCGHQYEEVCSLGDDYPPCPHCEGPTKVEKLISVTGGYQMNSGPSSVRPRGAGSRPKRSK